jgi:FdhD protein
MSDGTKMASDVEGTFLDPSPVHKGIQTTRYVTISSGSPQEVEGQVVEEALVCISVNGQELATFMCSPIKLDELALGFLYNEKIIESRTDVRSVHVSKSNSCVDVWLQGVEFVRPERTIITAGCGGGVTFDDLSEKHDPLQSSAQASIEQLTRLMRDMHLGANLYQEARGIHTAVLADNERILLQVEDVGRHNCLDRLAGAALIQEIDTRDRLLMSSGRISSEMINKARRLQTPIVCSRTSPTALSVALAKNWNITLVAYLRQNRMRIYSHPERILGEYKRVTGSTI